MHMSEHTSHKGTSPSLKQLVEPNDIDIVIHMLIDLFVYDSINSLLVEILFKKLSYSD